MRKRFSCGHVGLGQYCHRCAQAEEIEKMISQNVKLVTDKKKPKKHVWSIDQMKGLVRRLRQIT